MQTESISLCMIVKDEELVLENCLASVKDLVEEMIIVDTGSIDSTKEIALKYGAKIFDIPWENDFSKARNYSLSKASKEWILLLDADEVLNPDDLPKFESLMKNTNYDGYHFIIQNYLEDNNTSDYATHYAFRFLRNTGYYQFTGNIHEQIEKKDGAFDSSKFILADVTLFHYGYTSFIVQSKNKRQRNMPLLKKSLEESPNNPFFLFNLGNEYMADNDYHSAIEYYVKAHDFISYGQAYAPHLLYRMILCLTELKEYDKALSLVFEALKHYPECTDIEYCRAIIYYKTFSHLLAVKSLNRCIEMGDPPMNYKFLNDCATIRSYLLLGEIYFYQQDYESSLTMYQVVYESKQSPELLYKITPLLNLIYEDKDMVSRKLWELLSEHTGFHITFITKLLLQEKLLEQALSSLKELAFYKEYETEYLFLYAKLNFYKGNYKRSQRLLRYLIEKDISHTALGNLLTSTLILYYLSQLFMRNTIDQTFIKNLVQPDILFLYRTFWLLSSLQQQIIADENSNYSLPLKQTYFQEEDYLLQIIEEIIVSGHKEYLTYIDILMRCTKNTGMYLRVSKLFMKYNVKDQALIYIKKSLKEYDLLDSECAFYLTLNL